MSKALTYVAVGVAILGAAGAGSGQIPDAELSFVTLWPDAGMASCPAGDGPVFEYIIVAVRANDATPIVGVPWTEFFFTVTGGDVTIAPVTQATDPVGEIRFSMVADETILLLEPEFLTIECTVLSVVLDDIDYLQVNSFDLDGDGCVGVADFAIFASIYVTADPRGDFSWSGLVGLADFGLFSAHYLHGDCP